MQFKVPGWLVAVIVGFFITVISVLLYLNSTQGKTFYVHGKAWGFSNELTKENSSLKEKLKIQNEENLTLVKSIEDYDRLKSANSEVTILISNLKEHIEKQNTMLSSNRKNNMELQDLVTSLNIELSNLKSKLNRKPEVRLKELYFGQVWNDKDSGFSFVITEVFGFRDLGGIDVTVSVVTPESSLREHKLKETDKWDYKFNNHNFTVSVEKIDTKNQLVTLKIIKT